VLRKVSFKNSKEENGWKKTENLDHMLVNNNNNIIIIIIIIIITIIIIIIIIIIKPTWNNIWSFPSVTWCMLMIVQFVGDSVACTRTAYQTLVFSSTCKNDASKPKKKWKQLQHFNLVKPLWCTDSFKLL